MKYQTVIIRYNENVEWAKYLKYPAVIYNKGENLESVHPVVNLKNKGMFVASQLYHCITNYDKLADRTLFIQGNPWDGMFEKYNELSGSKQDVRDLEYFYFSGPPDQQTSMNFLERTIGSSYNQPPNYNQRHHNCFIKYTHTWQEWLLVIDPNKKIDWSNKVRFYKGGHMTLSKEAILSNPKEWYLMLLDYWKYDVPCLEWYTESSHNFVFNVNNNGHIEDYGHEAKDYIGKELDYSYWKR